MSIEAMKLALEAITKYLSECPDPSEEAVEGLCDAASAARAAIAKAEKQEQGEPVAWMRHDGQRVTTTSDRHNYPDYETRYSIPLYTTPQRTWVGLTKDDIAKLLSTHHMYMEDFVKEVEAKLKEKNT